MSGPYSENPPNQAATRLELLQSVMRTIRFGDELPATLRQVVTRIQAAMKVSGVLVVLASQAGQVFRCIAACFAEAEMTNRCLGGRFNGAQDVMASVLRSGAPLAIANTVNAPSGAYLGKTFSSYPVENLVAVPLAVASRRYGVLMAVNHPSGIFDLADIALFESVAAAIAMFMENLDHRGQLQRLSRQGVQFDLDRDRVIQRLSHELKTPLAVLAACLKLLGKYLDPASRGQWRPIYARTARNIERLFHMEYEIEDFLRARSDDADALPSFLTNHGKTSPGSAGYAEKPMTRDGSHGGY